MRPLSHYLSISSALKIKKRPLCSSATSVTIALLTKLHLHIAKANKMSPIGYIAEVTSLSPNAMEKDVFDFFSLCGEIEHVEIIRAGEYGSTAYITFINPHALETAVLLSGATIVDQPVCITRWGHYEDDDNLWTHSSWNIDNETSQTHAQALKVVPSASETVTLAQDVVKTMISKGYVLGKDALSKARAFDESHGLSSAAAAKVAELSGRIGLTDKICAGVEVARFMDQKFHIVDNTKSAISVTGKSAAYAANVVVNSSYFAKGALWVSDALNRASHAAADLASRGAAAHNN